MTVPVALSVAFNGLPYSSSGSSVATSGKMPFEKPARARLNRRGDRKPALHNFLKRAIVTINPVPHRKTHLALRGVCFPEDNKPNN